MKAICGSPAANVVFMLVALAAAAPVVGQSLSGDELRACAAMALKRPDRDPAQRAALETVRARIVAEVAAITAARPTVDRTRVGEVALFNDRVARACADYAAYVAAKARLASEQNALATAFNSRCADRDFDPHLAATLPDDLRAAWDAVTGTAPEQTAALSNLPPQPAPMAR